MKKIILLIGTIIFASFLNLAYGQMADWVNNQGCYCGGYLTVPVTYLSRGDGTLDERTASRDQMDYWNLYATIYSPIRTSGYGAPGNGSNEVNTFITNAAAQSIYGYTMNPSLYGVAIIQPQASFGTFNECKDFDSFGCDAFTETDVLINGEFVDDWTTDPNDYDNALVQTTALHEIGHTWGAHHVFTLPAFGDSYSTMNYINDDSGRFVTRMDANTIRAHYPEAAQSGIDVGIFPFIFGNATYAETYTSVSPPLVQEGASINISNFLIQNIGTLAAANTVITFYLSSDTVIEPTDYPIGTATYDSLPLDADYDLDATLIIPAGIPVGTYYIGAIVTVDGAEDPIGINNRFIIGRPSRTLINLNICDTYAVDDLVPFNFEDISASGTSLNLGDDAYAPVNIPFTFSFYGQDYAAVRVDSNGTIHFAVNDYKTYNNECIPGTAGDGIDTYIAPFWDDLNPSAGGAVYYAVRGTAPNRRLIVQWHQVPVWPDVGAATFQAILYEGSNNILFQYQDVDFGNLGYDNGASATVGLQLATNCSTQYSCNSASLSDGLAILFTLPTPSPPGATTGSASSIGSTTATLNGMVNPNGSPTDYYFEYGLTPSYGSTTSVNSAGSGTADVPVSAGIGGLDPESTYHFRIVATNSYGTTLGADMLFATLPASTPYDLTVNIVGSGTVTLNPPGGTYDAGTVVTLTATADPGWGFSGWSGDLTGSDNPATITMDADKNITATFVEGQVALTVDTVGQGTVSLDPPGGVYDAGTHVTLTATADTLWEFSHWSGDLIGSDNPDTITMDADKNIMATFIDETLPDYVYLWEDFEGEFVDAPNYGSIPSGWLPGGPYEVVAFSKGSQAHHGAWSLQTNVTYHETLYSYITRTFSVEPGTEVVNLRLKVRASTDGRASAVLRAGDWSTTRFWYRTTPTDWQTLTLENVPVPPDGQLVVRLDVGHDEGPGSTDFDIDCLSANVPLGGLPPTQYNLTVNTVGQGGVTLDPPGGIYDAGTVVTLTAAGVTPDWVFCGWSGSLSGVDNPATITLNANKSVTAAFIEVVPGDPGSTITSLIAVDPDAIPDTAGKPVDFPYGMMEMEVEVANAGDDAVIIITLPNPAPADYEWYKYTVTDGWLPFGRNQISGGSGEGAEFSADRTQVTLYITDNGVYDDDPTDRNVRDPSGLALAPAPPIGGGDGGGSGCFIATAAFGSPMESQVMLLREFRDRFLLTNCTGKAFVDLYYTFSPPVADMITKHNTVRIAVRCSLLPLVGLSWLALKLGFSVTIMLVLLLFGLLCTGAVFALKRMRLNRKK
ncbi:MAG: hypothetical protein JSU83_22930 [Deltaproteobacteria bacterium]|nr:MAG: hypothetical protein JSU83_22930 [Deltaproteobacteria bacterium]